jgi:hypothetical protein
VNLPIPLALLVLDFTPEVFLGVLKPIDDLFQVS